MPAGSSRACLHVQSRALSKKNDFINFDKSFFI